jgi:kynurenine formamidase
MARVVDLTHRITPGMPVYPGTEPPTLTQANTVERNGFAETLLRMYSHTGTHIDAPGHMVGGAASLDELPVETFIGPACVVDVSGAQGGRVDVDRLEAAGGLVDGCDFVLLHTGWSRHWGTDRYFAGFPVLSPRAAAWLVQRTLKGVGFDAISADAVGPPPYSNHVAFFSAGIILIENLTGLAPLIGSRFLFSCLPLSYPRADGSPVRAVAVMSMGVGSEAG